MTVIVPLEQKRELLDALTEGTNGKARLTPGDECRYVDAQGELFLL